MNIYVLIGLLGVCTFSLAAPAPDPPSWPYSSDLRYYYGYPGKTPYVYRASIEDDEEPLDRSRQDSGQLVSTLIHNAAVKQQDELKNFGNERPVETGSAAPVQQERPGDAPKVSSASATKAPTVVKPGVVNPPAFPPARKPAPPQAPRPTKPAPEEEEDEDDEDDEESAEDDDEDEEDEEADDDQERRRNEPIEAVTTQAPQNATSLESTEVAPTNASQPVRPVVEDSSNDVQDVIEVKVDTEDDVSDEASLDGVEAFVPGYVTDQGEVLVPVDTVTGDQPISIVPDPYSPPSRGVSLNYYGYNNGGGPGRVYRQEVFGEEEDESQEDEESNEDEDEEDESVKEVKEKQKKQSLPPPRPPKKPLHLVPASAPTNEDDELEGLRGYRNEAFPPSRSPMLYPVTFKFNGGYLTGPFDKPVTSSEVFQYIEPQEQQPLVRRRPAVSPNNIFYAYTQQRRTQPQRITVAVPASALYQAQRRTQAPSSRPMFNQGFLPYAYNGLNGYNAYNAPRPTYSNEQQYVPSYRPTLHNPGEKLKIKSSYELLVEPHSGSKVRLRTKNKRPANKKRPNKKKTQVVKRRPVTVIARPQHLGTPYRQPPQNLGYRQPPPASQAPVLYRPVYNVRPLQRVPAQGYRQPPYLSSGYSEYQNFLKGLQSGYYGNARPGFNRPTPVIRQDEPMPDSAEPSPAGQERKPKTRREAKKVKKQKKVVIKKKEDPLNILPLKKETKKPNM